MFRFPVPLLCPPNERRSSNIDIQQCSSWRVHNYHTHPVHPHYQQTDLYLLGITKQCRFLNRKNYHRDRILFQTADWDAILEKQFTDCLENYINNHDERAPKCVSFLRSI